MIENKTVTMKEIARECGVSLQTVSCIINGKEHLYLPETREKVLSAVKRLGYRPNLVASALAKKRSKKNNFFPPERVKDSVMNVFVLEPQHQRFRLDYVSHVLCVSNSFLNTGIRFTIDRIPQRLFLNPSSLVIELERIKLYNPDCIVMPCFDLSLDLFERLAVLPFPVVFIGDFNFSIPPHFKYNQISENTVERTDFAFNLAVKLGAHRIFVFGESLKNFYARQIKDSCEKLSIEKKCPFYYIEHSDDFTEERNLEISELYKNRFSTLRSMPEIRSGDIIIFDNYSRPDIFLKGINKLYASTFDKLKFISIGVQSPGTISIESDYSEFALCVARILKKLSKEKDLFIGHKVISGKVKFTPMFFDTFNLDKKK